MTDIQTFNSPEFGSIRSVEQNGEPWFVGKDVAEALGYGNPQRAIRDHVDALDKGVTDPCMNDGLFQLREYDKNGKRISGTQTMVTPKGRETFRLMLFGAKKD